MFFFATTCQHAASEMGVRRRSLASFVASAFARTSSAFSTVASVSTQCVNRRDPRPTNEEGQGQGFEPTVVGCTEFPTRRSTRFSRVRPRLTPAEVASNANSRVSRLERCIAQLSPDDGAELRSLQAALAKARAQSVLPHPAQQVEDCQQYCARAKRRLERAQEAAKVAQEAVGRFEVELQEGLRRLEELRVAAAPPPVPQGTAEEVPPTIPAEFVAEVNQLRGAVQELTRERDSLRAGISREGQPTQTMLAMVPAEARDPSHLMATLIEEADTDLRSQGRFAPY